MLFCVNEDAVTNIISSLGFANVILERPYKTNSPLKNLRLHIQCRNNLVAKRGLAAKLN